jgi:exonuclease SbcC
MLRKITLENFMAHARTVIELADGLTVLVGPNNCGKSAVVEALRTLCCNDNADHLLRHGAKQCCITVETDDGHVISWKRKGATVSYEIDGQAQHRLKRSVPDNLHGLLRLPKVTTPAGDTFDVHFGLQKTPIFLLDEDACERKAAAFFAASSDAEKLMEMQQKHREKVRNGKALHKDLSEELERSEKVLGTLAPLEELSPAIQRAELAYELIQKESAEIRRLEETIDQLRRQDATRRRFEQQCEALEKLLAVPVMADEVALDRLVRSIDAMRASAERARRTVDCVKPVVAPPVLADAQALKQVVVALDRAVRRHREMVAGCEALARLEKVPELADVEALTVLGKQLRAAGREVAKLAAGRDAMDRLVDVPALVDVTAVEAFIAQFTEKARRAQAVAVDVVELGKQLAEIEERLRVWAEANSTCPVCGGEIDPERVLPSEEHSHV